MTATHTDTPSAEVLLHQDTARRLVAWMEAKELLPGDWLPAERVLSKALGVSRDTLRRALGHLRAERIIELRGRRGHRLCRPRPADGTADSDSPPAAAPFETADADSRNPRPRAVRRIGITVWGGSSFAGNPAMNRTLNGFHEVCERRGAMMEMVVIPSRRLMEEDWDDLIGLGNGRDGLATSAHFPPASLGRIADAGFPMVFLNQSGLLPDIVENRVEAMRRMIQHLTDLGHRRIVCLSGPSHYHHRQAAEVFIESMAALGMAEPRRAVSWTYFTEYDGHRETRMFLESHAPTAVIAGDGYLALGALAALTEAGLSCPGDVSVGALSDFWTPAQSGGLALTAADLRHEDAGRMAGEMLLDWLEGRPPERRTVAAPFDFHVRDSTGPCRER